jgi:hypothetical protein
LRIALDAGLDGLALQIEKSRGGRPARVQLGPISGPMQAAAH